MYSSSYDRPIRNYKKVIHFKISGFHHSVDEVFTLLGCYIVYVDSCLLTFQDSLLVPSSKVKQSKKSLAVPKISKQLPKQKRYNLVILPVHNCNQYKFKVHPSPLSNQPVTSHTPTLTYCCNLP